MKQTRRNIYTITLLLILSSTLIAATRSFNLMEEGRDVNDRVFYKVQCDSGDVMTLFVVANEMTEPSEKCGKTASTKLLTDSVSFTESINWFCSCGTQN